MKLSLLFISVLHLLHAFSLWLYVSVWALQIPFFVLFSRESEVPVCLKTRRVSQGYIRPCEFYVDLNIVSYLVLKQDLWEEVVSSIVVTTRFCGQTDFKCVSPSDLNPSLSLQLTQVVQEQATLSLLCPNSLLKQCHLKRKQAEKQCFLLLDQKQGNVTTDHWVKGKIKREYFFNSLLESFIIGKQVLLLSILSQLLGHLGKVTWES